MPYLRSDFVKLYKSKQVKIMLIVLAFVMIFDPISVLIINSPQSGFYENVGRHYFQFWVLMNSVSWGNTVYMTLLWIFPVISTGLIMYEEKVTSVKAFLVSRNGWGSYYISKVLTVFISTFVNFFVLLSVNVLVTLLCFHSEVKTDQFWFCVPKEATFAYKFYEISPMCMIFVYIFLNALLIALLAVLIMTTYSIVRMKNKYIALIAPAACLYVIQYAISWLLVDRMNYDISLIIQPMASAALIQTIRGSDVLLTYGIIAIIVFLFIILGYKRGREIV